MKRFQFISRLTASAAVFALTLGTVVSFTACSDDDDETNRTTLPEKLAVPENIVSNNDNEGVLSFSWNAVEEADSYSTQIRFDPIGDIVAEKLGDAASVVFTDLQNGTTYYFRVRANYSLNESRNSDWSEWLDVKTKEVDPAVPQLDVPANPVCLSTETGVDALTFQWEGVEGAAQYQVLLTSVGEDDFNALTEETSFTKSGLKPGQTYFFKVKALPAADDKAHRASEYTGQIMASTLQQLATPVVRNTITMAEALRWEWAAVENAVGYRYELYKGTEEAAVLSGNFADVTTDPFKGETEIVITDEKKDAEGKTTGLSMTFKALDRSTYYYFRVQAVAAEGGKFIDSEWTDLSAVLTPATDSDPLATPVFGTHDCQQTTVVVKWAAVENAGSYELQWTDDAANFDADPLDETKVRVIAVEPDEETGLLPTEYTVKGLAASTKYYARLKAVPVEGDKAWKASPWTTVAEIATADLLMELTVSTADELYEAMIDRMATGGVITVEPGTYAISGTKKDELTGAITGYEPRTIVLPRGITVKGADASNRPAINYKQLNIALVEDGALTLENLVVTGFIVDGENNVKNVGWSDTKSVSAGGYVTNIQAASKVLTKLEIKNCDIYGFNNSFCRADQGQGVAEVVVDNSIISVGGDNGQLVGAHQKHSLVMSVTLRNSTFDRIGSAFGGQALGGGKNAALVRLMATPETAVTMENCTFYNIAGCSKNKGFVENKSGVTTFNNNIIVLDANIAGGPWSSTMSNGTIEGSGNFIFGQADAMVLPAGFTTADPGIAPTFMSSYAPTNSAVAGAGDPRWR